MAVKKMFTPVKIGSMEVKNRFVMPAMGTNLAEPDGSAGPRLVDYYLERAKGGFGLLIVECTAISKEGRSLVNECGIWDDSLIESYRRLTDEVHHQGAKIAMQLRHCGRETKPVYTDNGPVVAPSPVPCPVCQAMPQELSTQEVYKMVQTFGDAALRAKKAGFDAVELHASHGYLIAQFLSGHANKRTDEFGGTLHNRMRFLGLVLEDIAAKAGKDFPVIVRISGSEMISGGRDIEETKAVCAFCQEKGAAAIHVSISTYGSLKYCIGSAYLAPGYETMAAAEIKKSVSLPVITVGRYTDPEIAEAVVGDASADLVAFGRQSIADPHFVEKIAQERYDDVIPCISCNQGCIMRIFADEPISCVVNPLNGTEEQYRANRTDQPKHVVVAGGGPAGLQAAWILAARGHRVDLVERESYLGGAFLAAAYPPAKSTITRMLGYYIRQCKKYGVNVMTNRELDSELLKEMKPDAVVVATGSVNLRPPIKGLSEAPVLDPCDVLLGKVTTGQKVLVAGGGLIGAETADFLAEQGRDVTIIEMKPQIAADLDPYARPMLIGQLQDQGVKMIRGGVIQQFLADGVVYRDSENEDQGDIVLKGFDSVVLALGTRNYDPLSEAIKDWVPQVHVIGDARKAGKVYAATHEAAEVAMAL